MKVLIVEPDWRFTQKATSFLETHGHHVVLQPTACEALDRTRHWQPDLVIVAAELGETGLLESLHKLQPRPAVLLTGWMDRYDIVWRAWQKGGDDLLIKPMLRIEDLHEAIVSARENAVVGAHEDRFAARASA